MEGIISTLGWSLPVMALVILALGFLMGLWRGLFKAALRLVLAICALIVSKILVQDLLSSFAKEIGDLITDALLSSAPELAESANVGDIMAKVSLAIAAPILFLIVFLILNKLILILYAILKLAIRPLVSFEKKSVPCRRLIGGGVGVLCGALTLVAIMTPVGGYISVLNDTVALVESSEQGEFPEDFKETMADVKPLTDAVYGSPAVSIPYALGGKALFTSLSSFEVNLEEKTETGTLEPVTIKTNIATEFKGVIGIIPRAMALSDMHFENLEDFNVAPVRNLIGALDEKEDPSRLAVALVAQICSSASEAWIEGESYFGVNLDEMFSDESTAAFRPAVNNVLETLRNTSSKRIVADLTSLVDTVEGISATYKYMLKLTDADHVPTAEDVEELINNLTPEAVSLMRDSVPSIIESSGFDTEDEDLNNTVNKAADIMLDSLDKLASDPDITAEQKKTEATAINSMMTIITTATDENQDITDNQADELIYDMMTSSVLSESVINTAAEDDSTFDVDDHTSNTMRDALNKYESENAGTMTAEQQNTAEALRSLFAAH